MGNGAAGMKEESGKLRIKWTVGRERRRDWDTVRVSRDEKEKSKHDGKGKIQADVMLLAIKPGPGAAIRKGQPRSSVFTLKIPCVRDGYCSGSWCLRMQGGRWRKQVLPTFLPDYRPA
jgi:hypothetical protein